MTDRPYLLGESTWKTVAPTPYEVAVLPWGATEAHNYHLPYATDTIQCDALAAEAARRAWARGARVVVLPTVPFGVQTGQLDIKLCLNVMPSTQLALLRDLVRSLEPHGVRKLVILNGHGGNDFRAIVRELQPSTPVLLATMDWWKLGDPRRVFDEPGDHAGELETSLMMHVAPDLVRFADAGAGRERRWRIRALREGLAWAPRRWTQVSEDTGTGSPARATPEKGAAYFHAVTAVVAEFLVELAAADVDDLYGAP